MKKCLLLSYLLAGLVGVAGLAFAADTNPVIESNQGSLRVAVLDVQQILQQSPQLKAMADKAKKEFKPREEKILALQKTVADNDAKLKKDATVMTASEVTKLQEKIASDQRNLRRLEEDFMQDANKAQKVMMDKIVSQVNEIVEKVADEGHFDLILQKNNVAFASPRVDLTSKVLAEMKKK
jgi:outer membrane protein